MSTFRLPDLGEGLAEAEIIEWHVSVGDHVRVDQPMVSVETAKAVVEVPAPFSGIVTALRGAPVGTMSPGAPHRAVTMPLKGAGTSTTAFAVSTDTMG